ncbi:MAG: DUF302 domain-containing protein [Candidatus Omnitrophica bacterium]|nr:DUF302 domain-containing protein [Candidatus Omnitrophota bacterium]
MNSGRQSPFPSYGMVGLVMAVGLMALSGCQSMSAKEITLYPSKYQDIDQTCEALKTAIETQGFQCPAIRNLNQSIGGRHPYLDRQIRVVEFYKADYAHDMLNDNPEVCALMPCAFGVFEGKDHKIYISSQNQRFISEMPGCTLARVIDEYVGRDQAKILKAAAQSIPAMEPKQNHPDKVCDGDLWCEMYIGER